MPTLLQRPTLCSRNTYARVYVRERTYGRIYVRTCGRSFLRTRGGIIRSATINPNDDDAVMTLSRTSFQATSVTLRAHLLLFPRSLHLPLAVSSSLFPSSHMPTSASTLISTSTYIRLHLHPSVSIPGSLSRSLLFALTSSCPPRSHHRILFKLLVLTTTVYFEVGSYPVSTTAFPTRFVNNSSRPLKRATAIQRPLWVSSNEIMKLQHPGNF